ncbi:AAA family ATPase [Paenibacillus sp. TRM 82003]|nr:AAA family ATPase [Paenibacillus sp. TRM 82003]
MGARTLSGIPGFDEILYGGLPRQAVTILEGEPGTGKTTFGLQFLVEGAKRHGEAGLFVTFEQLPEQLYEDAASFGWDLRELERQGLLRIVSMEPDVLYEQMLRQGGLFERMVRELNAKRVVIDSISLFRTLSEPTAARTSVYTMRNILRKLGLTSMLVREYSGFESQYAPFENNVCDGIVRLSLKPHFEKYRKRTVEVLKMRGTRVMEGEHHFTFAGQGVHIIPALSMAEEKLMANDATEMLSTGIPELDELLHGGLPRGSVFLVDTNSKANHKYMIISMFAERLKAGDYTISVMSNTLTLKSLSAMTQLYGVSLDECVARGQSFFVEHYKKPLPDGYEDAVLYVGGTTNEQYREAYTAKLQSIFHRSREENKSWFLYYDLNTMISERGKDYVRQFFADETVKCRNAGISVVAHCNLAEVGGETASFLERVSNGVLRTWVDGKYQYLQIAKSPSGRMSAPKIVENIADVPYIRLV